MDIEKLQKGAEEVLNDVMTILRPHEIAYEEVYKFDPERLEQDLKEREIYPQSLVCALGSLAGFACQKDVKLIFMKKNGLSEDKIFTVMTDKQGRKIFFGDLLNEPLVNDKYSVWAMIGGAVKKRGESLPDVNDIFRYISYTAGGESFGKPRACEVGESMIYYLKLLWLPMLKIAKQYAGENELHVLFGIALQKAVYAAGGYMNVTEAARIAMESAVSMSKVDYNSFCK